MENLKRIGVYGISGAGKTTILEKVSKLTSNLKWLEGSKLILDVAGLELDKFKKLSEFKKYFYREKAINKAFEIQNREKINIIIDGHLAFPKGETGFENVMTKRDVIFYTDYIYLNLPPEIIFQRIQSDSLRKQNYSIKTLSNWAKFELRILKIFCKSHKLNLTILEAEDTQNTVNFICKYMRG